MKKILLFSMLILAGSQLRAQVYINGSYDYGFSLFEEDYITSSPSIFYPFFLFPDSTVIVDYEDGPGAVDAQSDGQVFDPTDTNFAITNYTLNSNMSYTVDTISFGYNYQRFQEAEPDTLLLQIYNDSEIIYYPSPGFSNGASFATVGYNYQIRAGANAIFSTKLALTDAYASPNDTDEFFLPFIVNIAVPAGKKIAATVTYFPGNPYAVGDTLDPSLNPQKQINSFQLFDFGSTVIAAGYYNNELTVDPTVRYNFNTNGWDSLYIPGTAYGDTVYNLDVMWDITFDSTELSAVKNIAPLVTKASIYPNPACTNCSANLDFNLTNDDDLTIDLINVLGMKIASFDKQHFNAGYNHLEISTDNLPAGIYICNIKGKEGSESLKMAVE